MANVTREREELIAKLAEEAAHLAKVALATNTWACVARSKRDFDVIGGLHRDIDAVREKLAAALASAPPAAPPEDARWRCFHCDEVFDNDSAAAEHFGSRETFQPACRIDIAAYRRLEAAYAKLQADVLEECTPIENAMRALQSEHAAALRRAEEDGYARGLAASAAPPDPPGQDDVTFWQMVADGVNHDPRCPNHFAGDPKGQPCMRCQLEAARQSAPLGLVSLARSLAEALWDMQSSPDCWCPPDRSCTDGHTVACAAARGVNDAAKRFYRYNELPLAARQSAPLGLEQRGWIIERPHGKGEAVCTYWGGLSADHWTRKTDWAVRFAREEDAELVRVNLLGSPERSRVAEHLWLAALPATDPQEAK